MNQPQLADLERVLAQAIAPDQEDNLSSEAIALLSVATEGSAAGLTERLGAMRRGYAAVHRVCCQEMGWAAVPLSTFWHLWLPLAEDIAGLRQRAARPVVQGFLGGQGTGKTTLCRILAVLLSQMGYAVASLSLDDLYKTLGDRQQLQQADPRLRWRGPPGTHDVALGVQVLQQVRAGQPTPILLPRFDKSLHQGQGDRVTPEAVQGVDVLLFEGWFVGVRPIDPRYFDAAPPPLQNEGDRAFARDCNTRLHAYEPLWDALDSLIFLHPVDYRLSKTWRRQAEQEMKQQGRSGMSDAEIEAFVDYFWQSLHPELFWPPLLGDRQRVNWVIDIHPDHTPGRMYRPSAES